MDAESVNPELNQAYSYTNFLDAQPSGSTAANYFRFAAAAVLALLMLAALRYAPWASNTPQTPDRTHPADMPVSSRPDEGPPENSKEFDELALVLDHQPPDNSVVFSFVDATIGGKRFEIIHKPGKSINCEIFEPPGASAASRSIEAWDLLELKLAEPSVFDDVGKIWKQAGAKAATTEAQIEVSRKLSVFSVNEQVSKIQGEWYGNPVRIAVDKAGRFVSANSQTTPTSILSGTRSNSANPLTDLAGLQELVESLDITSDGPKN